MRFYDDVMRDKNLPREVKDLLDGCIVVVCDNVASYYYEGTDKEYWDLSDFPNIAPPWGRFWLDFKAPKQCVSAEFGTRPWGPTMPTMWGLHCQASEVKSASELRQTPEGRARILQGLEENLAVLTESIERQRPDIFEIAQKGEAYTRHQVTPEQFTHFAQCLRLMEMIQHAQAGEWDKVKLAWEQAEGAYKWQMDVTLFEKMPFPGKEAVMGPLWIWRLFITDTGEIAKDAQSGVALTMSCPLGESKDVLDELQQRGVRYEEAWNNLASACNPFFHTAMLSISFLHCKNVALSETRPPKHIVRNKNAKRRGEQDYQPVTFKTLDIRPMKEVLQRAGAGAPAGEHTTRALHICRGHFAHYSEDKKLFGKYTGTFWRPQHVRGGVQSGVTVKDYRIKL